MVHNLKTILALEIIKSLEVLALMLFSGEIIDIEIVIIVTPLWPVFYVFFTFSMIVTCSFILKLLSLVFCLPVKKQECRRITLY